MIWVGYGNFSKCILAEGRTSLGLGPERVWLHPTSVNSFCFEFVVENGISQLHSATSYQCFPHPMNDTSGTVRPDKQKRNSDRVKLCGTLSSLWGGSGSPVPLPGAVLKSRTCPFLYPFRLKRGDSVQSFPMLYPSL